MSEINPQEFGELRARVEFLVASNKVLTDTVTSMNVAIQNMQLQMAEAKGGWRTLLFLGGAAASMGGLITAVISHFMGKGSA